MSRHLAGFGEVAEAPWVVLGGGGVKGLAHVGALRALAEAGLRTKGIVGTSIGALVGALVATGTPLEDIQRLALGLEKGDILRMNRRAVWIKGVQELSLFRGDVLRDRVAELLPASGWDRLALPLLVNAVDLTDGATAWFGTGARTDVSLVDAVYASSALPVFFPPFRSGERAYVDGGAAHPLAIEKAAQVGAARVVAIDVGSGRSTDIDEVLGAGMAGVHQRVFAIMTYRRRWEAIERWSGPPLLYVRPRLDGYGTFGFEHIEYFLEEGYRATREALTRFVQSERRPHNR